MGGNEGRARLDERVLADRASDQLLLGHDAGLGEEAAVVLRELGRVGAQRTDDETAARV